jgi:hypothetical protein
MEIPFDVLVVVAQYGGDAIAMEMGRCCRALKNKIDSRVVMASLVPLLFAYTITGKRRRAIVGKYVRCYFLSPKKQEIHIHDDVEYLKTNNPGVLWTSLSSLSHLEVASTTHLPLKDTKDIKGDQVGWYPPKTTHLTLTNYHWMYFPPTVTWLKLINPVELYGLPRTLETLIIHSDVDKSWLLDLNWLPPTVKKVSLFNVDIDSRQKWPCHITHLEIYNVRRGDLSIYHILACLDPHSVTHLKLFGHVGYPPLDSPFPKSLRVLSVPVGSPEYPRHCFHGNVTVEYHRDPVPENHPL